ncbi:hypothetical protein GYMLUDRAFT_623032 [Collybiopsis luxurians FD-317 M1]|nr:hypothetical protein GYMLUDRAFT_623032 [Collybiopsis luxurians FD-317 M1]
MLSRAFRRFPALRSTGISNIRTSSISAPSRRAIFTHVLAGVVGGLVVVGTGYTYYHFSGLKRAVDASKQIGVLLEQTKKSVQHTGNEQLNHLRQLVKSYYGLIPGSGYVIDRLFEGVDKLVEEHREEALAILARAQKEIDGILKNRANLKNEEIAANIFAAIVKYVDELGKLGAKAGGPLIQPMQERLSDVSEKVNEGVKVLRGFFSKEKKD